MNGRYVGYVAGDDPLHGFLSRIIRDRMEVREPQPAFRAFQLSGSNVVYAYEEKFSRTKIICKFYGPKFRPDLDMAGWMARQEYEGLKTLRRYNLIESPHHVIRPLGCSRDINGALALEYYAGEEFSHAITRATHQQDDAHLYWRGEAAAPGRLMPDPCCVLGARVAAGGGKWAVPWMVPWMVGVNLLVRMMRAPYVRSFGGFGRPWSHLEQLIEDVQVREVGFGGAYIVTGQVPSRPPS